MTTWLRLRTWLTTRVGERLPGPSGDDDVAAPSDLADDCAGEFDSDLAVVDAPDSDEAEPDAAGSDEPPDFSPAGPTLAEPSATFSRLSLR